MRNRKFGLAAILAIVIAIAAFALDITTKYLIVANLKVEGVTGKFLPGFINFVLVYNDGAGFSIFKGQKIFLIIITIVLIALFIAYFVMRHIKGHGPVSVLLGIVTGFIVGGCFGNLYDRLVFGYVRDFLNFEFINFPVFNVADICLCVGIFLLIIYAIFILPKESKNSEKKDKNG